MELNYDEITLEQCYNSRLYDKCVCDADNKKVYAELKEEYKNVYEAFETLFLDNLSRRLRDKSKKN